MEQTIYEGYGSLEKLKNILQKLDINKIFLITGKNSYSTSGAKETIEPILSNCKYFNFSDFDVNPNICDIEKGIELFKQEKCDCIIGIGGGSVMDIAKAISVLSLSEVDTKKAILNNIVIEKRKEPLFLIPTTAGTGSESTKFSVVYIDKTKYSLDSDAMLADFVILDPALTLNLPKYITACTAMDALCQAIESFWSVSSTDISRNYSKKAIEIILLIVLDVVNKPNKELREKMLLASNFSGRAINIAKTTAAHAVSYPLTSFFNIPHGHAVALTLSYFIEFNSKVSESDLQDKRGVKFVKDRLNDLLKILGVDSFEEAKEKILDIMDRIDLKTKLHDFGINKDNLDIIITNGFNKDRIKNNPRSLKKEELRAMLKEIL